VYCKQSEELGRRCKDEQNRKKSFISDETAKPESSFNFEAENQNRNDIENDEEKRRDFFL
jgi:hypothetical protein